MTAPAEYDEAMMIYRLCQAYQSLPAAGGVLEQSVSLLRMHAILGEGGYFEEQEQSRGAGSGDLDPWASLPMEAL